MVNYEKMYRKQLSTIESQTDEIYLLKQKINLLIYIIALQNHYLHIPFELPEEFRISKLPF